MSPRDARGFSSCCCVTGGRTRALNNCSGNSTRGAAPDADAIGPRTASRPLSLRECHGTPSGLPQGECRRACAPRHALTHEGLFSLKRARRSTRCSVSLPPARRSVSRKADFPQGRGQGASSSCGLSRGRPREGCDSGLTRDTGTSFRLPILSGCSLQIQLNSLAQETGIEFSSRRCAS